MNHHIGPGDSSNPALRVVSADPERPDDQADQAEQAGPPPSPAEPAVPPLTLTTDELAHELRVDERTIRRWDSAGKLPRPIQLGTRAPRWPRDVIVRWLASPKPDGTLPNRREWEAMEAQRTERLLRHQSTARNG